MSTLQKTTSADRLASLIRMQKLLFHTRDFANIWQIQNKNTLNTVLKRYTQRKLLYMIYKGFYFIVPISQLDPYLIGIRAMNEFSYIGGETVLFENRIIFQKQNLINIISSISMKLNIGKYDYRVRQLADQYLFNQTGISEINGISVASVERSVVDLLYFNPKYYFDANSLINWDSVRKIQKEIGYI